MVFTFRYFVLALLFVIPGAFLSMMSHFRTGSDGSSAEPRRSSQNDSDRVPGVHGESDMEKPPFLFAVNN